MAAVLVVLALVIGPTVAWVGLRGIRAADHLRTAGQLFRQLQAQAERGDGGGARTTLVALQKQTRAARAETGDPGWRAAGTLPGPGDNLAAVRTVAVTLDDLAHDGLPALLDTASSMDLSSLAPRNGRIDVTRIQRARPRIDAAATALRLARDRIQAIPADDLLPQVRSGIEQLRQGLRHAVAVTGTGARAAALLPPMLGAGGPRTYLVLVQNLAEARATGGMPGAYLVVEADHGAVRIVDQGTAALGLQIFDRPVLPLDPAMRALYTDRLGRYPANVNLTPHFPTSGALAREMYRLRTGRTVDAVVATDPVALSYLLAATGPVAMPTGAALTAGNAVHALLSAVYTMPSAAAQDAYFATAARAVFETLTKRSGNVNGLIAQLARAAGERRILVWSADPAEEKLIGGTTLEGALPITDGIRPTVGVFLNDAGGSKMSYYLTHAAELTPADCRPDGSRTLRLRVTLGSTAPTTGLTRDVTGLALSGNPYTVRTNVSVFSPTGGTVADARLDGAQAPLATGTERRRSVAIVTVDLAPGATRTLDVTLLTGIPRRGAGSTLGARLWTTPGVAPWKANVRSADNCQAQR